MNKSTRRLLDEMRDLGWSGDADAWEVDANACDPEDRADFTLDLSREVRLMRRHGGLDGNGPNA